MADINLVLDFTMERQHENNWCWAATGKSVSHFYFPQSEWTQCGIATAELGSSCCNNPSSCDEPWYLDSTLIRTGNFDRLQEGVISWQQIMNEIMQKRVMCAFIDWHGSGGVGHFVAIFGVEKEGRSKRVCIDDPIYGERIMTYTRFRDNYRALGAWTWTYFTKS